MTSRPPPPRFEGCTLDGVRYGAGYALTGDEPRMRSASLVAVDEATGRTLWQVALWEEPTEGDFGLAMPPRFLHRVTADARRGTLRVVDEYGFAYVVHLATRSARALGRPDPAEAAPTGPRLNRHASRGGRPSPAAISFEGRRYQQIRNGKREGLGQRTGLLSVTDESSNLRVDVARIYDYPRPDGLEADAGDVFFVSAQLDEHTREIVIESERHERFAYGIDDGRVRKLH